MKKTITLLMMAVALVWILPGAIGQNLMLNAGVEQWDDPNNPTDWDKAESISQETVTIHEGAFSAAHTSSDGGTQDFQQVVENIAEGINYTISYWFFDNDTQAKARIWSYWLSGTTTLDAHVDILRPSVYSTDNPDWQHFTATLTAPPTADGFRFEVRVYHQDNITGGSVFYDEFSVEAASLSPEPDNYPTDFAATAESLSVNLSWTDATGGQLPNRYLLLGSSEDNIALPVDGTFVDDDPDMSDGSGALNIEYGQEMAAFSNLLGQATYFFKIFPYTNGGEEVDYKTDGTPPAASATTANLQVIHFIDFNSGWGDWERVSVTGAQEWEIDDIHGPDDSPCAKMSGYESVSNQNEDWLISPPMNFDMYADETLHFWTAMNYDGPVLQLKISTDYDGGGDPVSATWTDLTAQLSEGSWEWAPSGDVGLDMYSGDAVHLAFMYTSTDSESSTWELDDVLIIGVETTGLDEPGALNRVTVFPNPSSGRITINTPIDNVNISIYSIIGELMYEESGVMNHQTIQLHNLGPGVYFIKVQLAGSSEIRTQKLVIK